MLSNISKVIKFFNANTCLIFYITKIGSSWNRSLKYRYPKHCKDDCFPFEQYHYPFVCSQQTILCKVSYEKYNPSTPTTKRRYCKCPDIIITCLLKHNRSFSTTRGSLGVFHSNNSSWNFLSCSTRNITTFFLEQGTSTEIVFYHSDSDSYHLISLLV